MTQPSVFESRTPEVIKSEILTALTASGVAIDTREGSYTNTLISQISYALWQHSQLLAGLLLSCSLVRTVGSTWISMPPSWAWCGSQVPRPGQK